MKGSSGIPSSISTSSISTFSSALLRLLDRVWVGLDVGDMDEILAFRFDPWPFVVGVEVVGVDELDDDEEILVGSLIVVIDVLRGLGFIVDPVPDELLCFF